jgi:uncharacterized Zn finger protein
MSEGTVLVVYCESCDEETPHRVIRGELHAEAHSGFEGSVQCQRCSTVHHASIPSERPLTIPLVLSEGERSRNASLTISPLEEIGVGDEMVVGENNVVFTAVISGGKKVRRAKGKDVAVLHAKVFDTVTVRVSISRGPTTRSETMHVPPDEEFQVGDILEFGRMKVVADRILADSMVQREGIPVKARDIKRIYGKIVRERAY